jgi:hypothetical protein
MQLAVTTNLAENVFSEISSADADEKEVGIFDALHI